MGLDITYLGHSGFVIGDGERNVVIDPFLTGNPVAVTKPESIKCATVLLTHGHEDHVGDAWAIAKRNNATVIACHEVTLMEEGEGVETIGGNPGGRIDMDWGWVAFTQAFHSSSHSGRYTGTACGIVMHMAGVTIYHAGDTGLFSDMELIGKIYRPDIAFLPIGDRYTMGPELASMAAEMIDPKVAIPIHYKTFPFLKQSAEEFQPDSVEVRELEPGETWHYG